MTAQVVVVTGGSSGIGRATCFRFAEEGYRVVVADVREEPREGGTPTHERIQAQGGTAAFIETNVADWDDVRVMVEEVVDRFGRIDVLVNNAGFAERGPITEMDISDAHNIFLTNIHGVFHGMKAALPYMTEGGSIVNISSGAGKQGMPGLAAYCGSKFAVIGMTEAVAREVEEHGITVNAVCPGRTSTAMTDFEGVPAEDVAEIIYRTSQAKYTGRAVDVQ